MPGLPRLEDPLSDGVIALREWSEDDVEAMIAPLNEGEIARWTRVPSPYQREHAEEFVARMNAARRLGEELALAIVSVPGGELLGSMSVRVTSWEHHRGELGYLVFAHARGKGVASRAVRLLARYSFDRLGLRRIGILAAVDNAASQRVADNAGFTREGVLRSYMDTGGERQDMVSFSLLPEDGEGLGR
jgi:RimJ/RimL family protein N-acetyltransferase